MTWYLSFHQWRKLNPYNRTSLEIHYTNIYCIAVVLVLVKCDDNWVSLRRLTNKKNIYTNINEKCQNMKLSNKMLPKMQREEKSSEKSHSYFCSAALQSYFTNIFVIIYPGFKQQIVCLVKVNDIDTSTVCY